MNIKHGMSHHPIDPNRWYFKVKFTSKEEAELFALKTKMLL